MLKDIIIAGDIVHSFIFGGSLLVYCLSLRCCRALPGDAHWYYMYVHHPITNAVSLTSPIVTFLSCI